MCGAVMRGAVALPGSEATSRTKGARWNLGDLVWPAVAVAIRAAAGRRGAEAAVEQARSRTSLVVLAKRPNKAAMSGGGGRGGKGARSEGWQTTGDAPGAEPDQASCTRRLPADRRCGTTSALARSRPTSGKSPVRESRTPGSVRGAGRNPCPYRDSRERINWDADAVVMSGRRNGGASTRARFRSCVVEDPGMSVSSSTGNRETSTLAAREVSGPHREGDEPKPMMHGDEVSDSATVAVKRANEAGRPAEQFVEPRAGAKEIAEQDGTPRTAGTARPTAWTACGKPYASPPTSKVG